MEEQTLTFPNLRRALEEYGYQVAEKYKANLTWNERETIPNSLINSVKSILSVKGQTFEVQLELNDYWKYVEWDTRPHFPPLDAMLEYVRIKPVIAEERNGITPTESQLAFLIGRAISRNGTKGTHDLRDAVQELSESEWYSRIMDALSLDIEEQADIIITQFMQDGDFDMDAHDTKKALGV